MFNAEHLQEKWAPLLEAEGVDKITDPHRKAVTAVLLENQEKFLRDEQSFGQSGSVQDIHEVVPTNSAGSNPAGFSGSAVAGCLLYTSPSPRDATLSRMPSSA